MKESETLLNSFISNTTFKSLVSMGSLQFTTMIFFEWTRGAMVLQIAVLNSSSLMSIKIYGTNLFPWVFFLSVIISLISIAIRGSGRIRYNDAIVDKE